MVRSGRQIDRPLRCHIIRGVTKKRVYVAHTGGTIGMAPSAEGYETRHGYLQEQLRNVRELSHPSMPEITIHDYDTLLDSANMAPADWERIARDIALHHDEYDGIVVLHGTDTMAYTASALPFLLQGLRKPVVITGSQIPLCEIRNDAQANLITSLLIASSYDIPEVCLYFGGRLLRGCRATKVSAAGFAAFDSPNFPTLGTVGIEIDINWDLVRRPLDPPALKVDELSTPVVSALRLFPGISPDLLRNVLRAPLQGLVLEAYGIGNGPDQNAEFMGVLEEATSRGVVIVDCSQCLVGRVDLNSYAAGTALKRAGVISAFDMTVEATLAKLFYLFSRGYDPERVKREMQVDYCGELTGR